MLKKRIIPVLLLREGRMVKGVRFADYRDTGNPKTAVRTYSAQDADELIFINIEQSDRSRQALVDVLHEASEECFMPLTAGGGIRSIEEASALLRSGADKVVVTTAAVTSPRLLRDIAERFGTQSLVAGIDYRGEGASSKVWIRNGAEETNLDPINHAINLVDAGAGEIFLNCIDRDGCMEGYDLKLAEKIAHTVSVPVICCGGAGNFMHLFDLFNGTKVSAAACASIFHFGDNNPIRARSYLRNLGVPMRVLK